MKLFVVTFVSFFIMGSAYADDVSDAVKECRRLADVEYTFSDDNHEEVFAGVKYLLKMVNILSASCNHGGNFSGSVRTAHQDLMGAENYIRCLELKLSR